MQRDRGLEPIFALVARARRRMRLQRGLERACTAAIWTTGLALLGVQLVLAGYAGPGIPCLIAATTLFTAAVVQAVVSPLSDDIVAQAIDRASGLDDRLRTALAFDRGEAHGTLDDAVTQALIGAAIVDGVRAVPRGDVVRAAPVREPENARLAAVVIASAVALAGIPHVALLADAEPPAREAAVAPPVEIFDDPETGEYDRLDVGFELGVIEDLEALGHDKELESLICMAQELREFTCRYGEREVTKEQLLVRLAELEQRTRLGLATVPEAELPPGLEDRLDDVREALVRLPDRLEELRLRSPTREVRRPPSYERQKPGPEVSPTGPATFGDPAGTIAPPMPAPHRISQRDTINAAAQQGFATSAYRAVYAQYQRVIEETMHIQKVPPSYRYFVKRYFHKIHPVP